MSLFLTNGGASLVLATGGIPVLESSPLERGDHPRLLMVPDGYTHAPTFSELRTLIGIGGAANADMLDVVEALDYDDQAGRLWNGGTIESGEDLQHINAALGWAFAAYMRGITDDGDVTLSNTPAENWQHTKSEYATRAVEIYIGWIDACIAAYGAISSWPSDVSGNALIRNSYNYPEVHILYDWMYPLMTGAQRTKAADFTQALAVKGAASSQYGVMPADTTVGSNVANQLDNSYAVFCRTPVMCAALCLAGDGYYDEWASYFLNRWNSDILGDSDGAYGVFGWMSAASSSEGSSAEGQLYYIGYEGRHFAFAPECYRTAYGLSRSTYYAPTTVLGKLLNGFVNYRYLYHVPDGKDPNSQGSYLSGERPTSYSAAYPGGFPWLWLRGGSRNTDVSVYGDSRLYDFCQGVLKESNPTAAGIAKWWNDTFAGPYYGLAAYPSKLLYKILPDGYSVSLVDPRTTLGYSVVGDRNICAFYPEGDPKTSYSLPKVAYWYPRVFEGNKGERWPGQFAIYRKGWPTHAAQEGHSANGIGMGSYLFFPNLSLTLQPGDTGAVDWQAGNDTAAFGYARGATSGWIAKSDALRAPSVADTSLRSRLMDTTGDVDYVWSDLTDHYPNTSNGVSPGEVDASSPYIRQFVYFRPANYLTESVRVVVFDRAKVINPRNYGAGTGTYAKVWNLRWNAQPSFDGSATVNAGPSRGATGTDGKTYATNCTYLTAGTTAQNQNWTMYQTPLYPTDRHVIVVGGPNTSSGENWKLTKTSGVTSRTQHSHEWENVWGLNDSTGQSQPGDVNSRHYGFVGQWHSEVIPTSGDAQHTFVNVIEVGDNGASRSTTVACSGTNFIGACVGNRFVAFGELSDVLTSGTIVLPDTTQTYKGLIVGLNPSAARTFSFGASITSVSSLDPVDASVSSGDSLTATAAGTLYVQLTVTAGGNAASRTITIG